MGNIIEVKDLVKTFSDQPALEGVDFQVRKGEIFGFLGPSGSGKTTTIKILTGQMNPTSGSATAFGQPVSKLKLSDYRKRFGVLTDNSGLYERLSINDNLKLYCDLYDVHRSRIEEALAAVNLTKDNKKIVSTLSKGMKQRVILARALLHEPELLFLDEPTSALDPTNTLHIYEGLRALNTKGTTIFLTTHDMYEADTLCDRVAFLNKGKIQLLDTPDNLKRKYANGTITVEMSNEQKIVVPIGTEGAQQLYELMKTDRVERVHSNEPTLGDIFIQVTGRKLA
ncbi:bacitracin ABC transporter ATP-binding protein [Siminovitchia terrae]|uniref:ABC transporter ATP-binding protein n=1 Tax=Siminovitchia terrae TaxID=1914933 RepID=A0A429X3Z3_SIMTE|nr:ABC transporter ATP-binding protein [Siminovitchia terrae]RST58108.1 ABC transporter ATP-binding protein [Siminovitchia terrae]GIN91544.1 bacitracin ABC transporter ATP-binding protein [Siminovitchia terrae]GIN95634.1 bacitracin ABC transporter ATP-binding protein [Siminovitchia terrae]